MKVEMKTLISGIKIPLNQHPSEYQRVIEEQLDEILAREDILVEERFSILQSTIAEHIEHASSDGDYQNHDDND